MGADGRKRGLDIRGSIALDWEGLSLRRISDSGELARHEKPPNLDAVRTSPPAALISSARVLRFWGFLAIRAMR